MTRYVAVLGTHAWDRRYPEGQWWHPKSPFSAFLRSHDCRHAKPMDPFVWSGDLDGALLANGNDWEAGGKALKYYLRDLPYDSRNVIAHSHGGQVALYAAMEVPIRSLVMVGTPVRKEIEQSVCPVALERIGTCVHVSDKDWDWMGMLGAVFDRRWRLRRTFTDPAITTIQLKKIGHSGLLNNPALFPLWVSEGLIAALGDPALGVGA